jgi:hypothetical protein
MLRVTKCRVSEQRANCGEPSVTGAHTIFLLMLQMIEERADELGIEVVGVHF